MKMLPLRYSHFFGTGSLTVNVALTVDAPLKLIPTSLMLDRVYA